MTLDGQARIDAAHRMEFPGRPNGFSEFARDRALSFDRYAELTRSLREIEAQARKDIVPLMEEYIRNSGGMPGVRPKTLRLHEAHSTEAVFDHNAILANLSKFSNEDREVSAAEAKIADMLGAGQTPTVNLTIAAGRSIGDYGQGKLDIAKRRLGSAPQSVQGGMIDSSYQLGVFKQDYILRVGPMIIESRALNGQLTTELEQYMTSGYAALPDLVDFLSEAEFAQDRELVRAFFRDLVYQDPSRRNQPNLISKVREYWQREGPKKFDPIIFDRFWDDLNRSSQKNDIIGWVKFGAIVAQMSRDEAQGQQEPDPAEIRRAVARVPLEYWPKPLLDSYASYIQKDAAGLMESIRVKAQNLFPRTYSESVRSTGTVFESKKRQKIGTTGSGAETEANQKEEINPRTENGAHIHKLGLIKRSGVNNDHTTHVAGLTAEGNQSSVIADLVSDLPSPELKQVYTQAILRLLEDPYHRGSAVLNNPEERFTIVLPDGKLHTGVYRKFDTRGFEDINSKDQSIRAFRIVYGVVDGAVYIRGIFHHSALTRPRPKSMF